MSIVYVVFRVVRPLSTLLTTDRGPPSSFRFQLASPSIKCSQLKLPVEATRNGRRKVDSIAASAGLPGIRIVSDVVRRKRKGNRRGKRMSVLVSHYLEIGVIQDEEGK